MPKKPIGKTGAFDIPQMRSAIKTKSKKFKFTSKQKTLLDLILAPENSIIFIAGPAGTSKTYMALYAAIQLMIADPEKQLLYVRSIIESADKGLGSLPGDIAEKFDPFLMPLYDKLEELIVPQDIVWLKNEEKIASVPVNFLRGANWVNKIIVADESQNFTFKELTTLITRIGETTKLIVCGDFMQSDINGKSGFRPMFDLFNDEISKERGIHCFKFGSDDIVRSEILKFLMDKLENYKP